MTRHVVLVALAIAASGCAATTRSELPEPPRSPLELRQAQSRTFDTPDGRLVLKAALNVLQDQGFVIQQAQFELGLITAVSEWRSAQRNQGLQIFKWVAALPTYGASLLIPSGRDEFSAVEAVVNVNAEAEHTRVRVSMVVKVRDDKGATRRVRTIDDLLAYQKILGALDKAVYLQKEGL